MDDIHKAENRPENFLGIHNFAEQGIVGRGILVDFARWRERQTSNQELVDFECFKATPIKLAWIKQILQEQGTEVRYGDILIVRSGFMAAYLKLSQSEIQTLIQSNPPPVCGVEQSEEGLQCEFAGPFVTTRQEFSDSDLLCPGIWENFSAVAGDQPAFERYALPAFQELLLKDSVRSLFCRVVLQNSVFCPKHHVAYPCLVILAAVRNGLTLCRLPIATHFLPLWAGRCMKSCLRAGAAQSGSSLTWKNWPNTVRRRRDGISL
jgi:hypothetical protein